MFIKGVTISKYYDIHTYLQGVSHQFRMYNNAHKGMVDPYFSFTKDLVNLCIGGG